MAAPTNPYTSVSVSGFNSNPPPDDGTRDSTNQLTWAFHKEKLGDPLNTAIALMDINIAAAFGDLIVTTDAAQDALIEAVRRFIPRATDERLLLKRLLDRVESPLSENRVVLRAVFS